MKEVASDYLLPIQKKVDDIKKQTITHVTDETNRLKEYLKNELVKIDSLLDSKLKSLASTKNDTKATEVEIKRKENNLAWLESIQKRVEDLVEF